MRLMLKIRLPRYSSALKCLKRAHVLSEPDDCGVMVRMADQCMLMNMPDESRIIWLRVLQTSTVGTLLIASHIPLITSADRQWRFLFP